MIQLVCENAFHYLYYQHPRTLKAMKYHTLTTHPERISFSASSISSLEDPFIVHSVPPMYSPNTSPSIPLLFSKSTSQESKSAIIKTKTLKLHVVEL